jgi:drug/metabolite transporter (DMT)-like permease
VTVSHRARVIAAFATVYVMWGGTFLAIRYAVADVPPLMTMVLRCAGGAALLYAWLLWRRGLERPSRSQWLTAGAAGVFYFLGCHGLLAWAEQRVTSGEAALFMTGIPLWLVALEAVLVRRAPSRRVVLALLLGISGVAVLTWGETQAGGLGERVVLVVSALFWAVGTLIVRRGGTPLPTPSPPRCSSAPVPWRCWSPAWRWESPRAGVSPRSRRELPYRWGFSSSEAPCWASGPTPGCCA